MAGLVVPAIHVFLTSNENVDARHKAGHDESVRTRPLTRLPRHSASKTRVNALMAPSRNDAAGQGMTETTGL